MYTLNKSSRLDIMRVGVGRLARCVLRRVVQLLTRVGISWRGRLTDGDSFAEGELSKTKDIENSVLMVEDRDLEIFFEIRALYSLCLRQNLQGTPFLEQFKRELDHNKGPAIW